MLHDTGKDLSDMTKGYMVYSHRGETNFEFAGNDGDPKQRMKLSIDQIEDAMRGKGTISRPDGLLVEHKGDGGHYFISARTSNTEPKLRLNIESSEKAEAQRLYETAEAIILQNGGTRV
jgi:phosphomannomutase